MSEFKKGDVVRLNSGGPEMTIDTADLVSGKALCRWFVGNKLEQGIFSKVLLEKVEDGITFNKDWRKLSYQDRSIYLTPHEALIMELFLHHPNFPVTHKDIILLVSDVKQPRNPAEITLFNN